MGPLKILRVIPDLQVGGVQRMLFRSLETLAARGVRSEIACLSERGELAPQFERAGFPVHTLGFSSRLDPAGLWRLRQLVRRGGFHLVHSHMYAANLATNCALIGNGAVAVLNGYHSHRPTQTRGQAWRVRSTQWKPGAFLAVSRAVADALLEIGIPESRIRIVYNGIAVPAEPPPVPHAAHAPRLDLVWIGRFVRQKRVPFLLDVVEVSRRRGVPLRLTLVGDGPRRQEIERRIREKNLGDVVRLVGFSSNVEDYLKEADLFISASEREGFSNTVLEAGAMGRGMLLSDIPPHREFLMGGSDPSRPAADPSDNRDDQPDTAPDATPDAAPPHGRSGDPLGGLLLGDDPAAWASALESLSGNAVRLAHLGRAAWTTSSRFSLETVTETLHELYLRLVKGGT